VYECPVCGNRGLTVKPYEHWPPPPTFDETWTPYEDQLGRPSHEVCPTCGFEFGNDDNPGTGTPLTFADYRADWMSRTGRLLG
jgi:hypothetical protein